MNCLLQLQSVAERLADDLAHYAIGVEGRVEDDRAQLAKVDLPVREDAFVRLRGHDLADQVAGLGIPALDRALQRQRILLDGRCVDVRALMDVAAGLLNLVDFFPCLHAEVIGDEDSVRCTESGCFSHRIANHPCTDFSRPHICVFIA